MITAQEMNAVNQALILTIAERTQQDVQQRRFSPAVNNALDQIRTLISTRLASEVPFRTNSVSIRVIDVLADTCISELVDVLRNLGYVVTLSCSSNPNNEQITIK